LVRGFSNLHQMQIWNLAEVVHCHNHDRCLRSSVRGCSKKRPTHASGLMRLNLAIKFLCPSLILSFQSAMFLFLVHTSEYFFPGGDWIYYIWCGAWSFGVVDTSHVVVICLVSTQQHYTNSTQKERQWEERYDALSIHYEIVCFSCFLVSNIDPIWITYLT
jgi:hypothetical protein